MIGGLLNGWLKKISFVVMHIFNKKHITLVALLLITFSFSIKAQINHFIYLQTDNKQPFYIKYNSKIYSSTTSGYLILSKLNEGVINFTVGFPQSQIQEMMFELPISKIEKGFLLKNFNEKGWGLFDLQSSNLTYAVNLQISTASLGNTTPNTQVNNDPFANMLSTVTQDTTVKNVTVKKEEKIAIDSLKPVVQPSIKQPTKIDTPNVEPAVEKIVPPVISKPEWLPPVKSEISKLKFFQSKEGSDVIFEIKYENGITDTVRLFIQSDSSQIQGTTLIISEPIIQKDTIALPPLVKIETQVQPEIKKEQIKTKDESNVIPVENKGEVKAVPNSNCLTYASEDDFIKLRRKMASQTKDETMVSEAKKVFKTRCFSTAQLKNLSVLFLSDEWRYRFYDAALPFVSDFSNFRALEETIKDDYYIKRFQALFPNQ